MKLIKPNSLKNSIIVCVIGAIMLLKPYQSYGQSRGQEKSEKAEEVTDKPCSDPKKLQWLCTFVGTMKKDPKPQGRYKWMYQRRLFEAACVDPLKDSEEEIGKKIARVLKENEDALVCRSTSFDTDGASLFKFAISTRFDHFIYDMIEWKVDLNKVDKVDNRTVLDYVEYQIERNKGTGSERALRSYYRILKEAGAKHKREL